MFDLDPPEGQVELARRAALRVREMLDELGLPCRPVATGSKGYHVITVIEPQHRWGELAKLTRNVSALLTRRHADELTSEFRKKKRAGRVFVDWLRNQGGSTVVAPWSLRPRGAAPVAVPLDPVFADEPEPPHPAPERAESPRAASEPAPMETVPPRRRRVRCRRMRNAVHTYWLDASREPRPDIPA